MCKVFLIFVFYCCSSLKCVLVTIKFLIDDSKLFVALQLRLVVGLIVLTVEIDMTHAMGNYFNSFYWLETNLLEACNNNTWCRIPCHTSNWVQHIHGSVGHGGTTSKAGTVYRQHWPYIWLVMRVDSVDICRSLDFLDLGKSMAPMNCRQL